MYDPSQRKLIESTLKISKKNCKYLKNKYLDHKKIERKECYDFVKIHIFNGVIHDRQAYETLSKGYGLFSDKVSPFNVLQFKTF